MISLTDDTINEADEVFVVLLELNATMDPNQVNLGARNASLCRIGDNDRKFGSTRIDITRSLNYLFPTAIFIGFEFASYTYTEQDIVIPNASFPMQDLQVIHIIKSIESEQTFDIGVRAAPGGGKQEATFRVDYNATREFVEFRFDQDRLLFPISLFQDDMPEGTETFQLISFQLPGRAADFNPSVNATATVTILDDGDCKCY